MLPDNKVTELVGLIRQNRIFVTDYHPRSYSIKVPPEEKRAAEILEHFSSYTVPDYGFPEFLGTIYYPDFETATQIINDLRTTL